MSEIKSAKAYNHIYERFCCKTDEVCGLEYWDGFTEMSHSELLQMLVEFRGVAVVATKLAEQQAEERHAKAMQELKDKAVEAFAAVCKSNFGNDCERCAHGMKGDYCKVLELFTQKLNEQ